MSLGNKENSNNEEWVNKSPKKEQLLEFKESINTFFQKMHTPAMKPWYEIIQKRNKPAWLPPQPFLNIGVKTRLIYERMRAKSEI